MAVGNPILQTFVSHNLKDQGLAIRLNDRIGARGLATFLGQVELPKAGGKGLHRACYEAVARSQIMLVCVGPAGIGPSQDKEIEIAFQLEAEGRLEILLVLLGSATREAVPEDLPSLRSKVPYRFDPPGEDGRELLDLLERRTREVLPEPEPLPAEARDRPSPAPPSEILAARAESAADNLAESVVKHGLTVFVGSLWPDREDGTVFNPNRVAVGLLDEAEIPVSDPDRVMSLDQAALCFSIARGGDAPAHRDAQDEILERISMASLVGPRAYEALARLAGLFHERSRDRERRAFDLPGAECKPFVLTTTNVDRLLERYLAARGVPFLRLVPNRAGGAEQAVFERISNLEDGRIRIETTVTDEEGRQEVVSTETTAYGKDVADKPPWAERFRGRLERLGHRIPQEVWRDFQIDLAIRAHSQKVGISCGLKDQPDPKDLRRMERARAAAIDANVPILLKVFGCVDGRSDRALNLGTMLQFSGSSCWIPQDVRTRLGATASLFAGHSYADLRFLHLYQRALEELFERNSDRRRVLVCPAAHGPRDGYGEVDSVLLRRLRERSGDNFRTIKSVDDDPASFIERLMRRELTTEMVFV